METLTIIIPGECRGKMRPKATYFAGHARVYTPAKQTEYENWVRECFVRKYPSHKPIDEEYRISIQMTVFFPIPKSMSKKKKAQAIDGLIRPTKKPDLDNCIKSLDALNGIAWKDDAQITSISAEKRYSEAPRVELAIHYTPNANLL